MVFIFATMHENRVLVESNIGPCQFCSASQNTVNVEEHHSQTVFFGLFPAKEVVHRLAVCHNCGRSIKEEYYSTMQRPGQGQGAAIHDETAGKLLH